MLHTGGASWPSHIFLEFGSVFAPVVLRFRFHVIKIRPLFSLSSPNSFPRIFPPTTPMPSHSHCLAALIPGVSLKTAVTISRKVEKTSATQGGYQQVSCLLCKYHGFRGGFSARDVTYLRRAGTARPISAQTAGRDTEKEEHSPLCPQDDTQVHSKTQTASCLVYYGQ